MPSYINYIFDSIKQLYDFSDSHYYDINTNDELVRNLSRCELDFPAVLILEEDNYFSDQYQNGIDLKKEARVNSDFTITLLADSIDKLIEMEEAISSKYSTPQKLSDLSDERCVSDAEVLIDTEKKIERCTSKTRKNEYQSILHMKCNDIILPQEIVNPIKIELDKNIQLQVMKHLSLLNNLYSKFRYSADIQHDIEEQISSMYTFENLCHEKITLDDNGFSECYSIMIADESDISNATAVHAQRKEEKRQREEKEKKQAETKKQREEERLKDVDKRFSKKGDKVLNRFTDAVVEDIASKLNFDFPITVYGGSSFVEWYRLEGNRILEYPNILIYTDSNFTFEHKVYTNIANNGTESIHGYGKTAFPINYGVSIRIMAKDQEQSDLIENKLYDIYSEKVEIHVPDPVIAGEFCSINIEINTDVSVTRETLRNKADGSNLINTVITCKRFPSVYYPIEYIFTDITDDQPLQVRLIQQAQFLLLCDSKIRSEAIKQLDTDYKKLFGSQPTAKSVLGFMSNAISSALQDVVSMAYNSEEFEAYKTLRTCIKNGQAFDRKTFDKAFSKIIGVYPNLYDKMMQGWSIDRIREDLNKYAEYFNERWNSICNSLAVGANPFLFKMLGMSGDKNQPLQSINKGLIFSMEKMIRDPYCSLSDVEVAYKEQLLKEQREAEEQERRTEEWLDSLRDARAERRESGSSGGFLGNVFNSTKPKTNSNGTNSNGIERKNYYLTSKCQRSPQNADKKNCAGCTLLPYCTYR
ncbi:MAG: hypothetical protein HFE78_05780 [Clostridiales bacterium]|nr:hypothetical protein [Clostridiales bacterium]